MSVGVDFLDAHHRQVWRRVRHVANAVSDGRADEVRSALRVLLAYLAEHDVEEEREMEAAGYPGAREHARSHAAIRERIAQAREGGSATSPHALLVAADGVARALCEHLGSDDRRLGRFLTARANLRRLAEEGPGAGLTLTPVPGSLPPARTPSPGSVPSVRPGRDDGSAPGGPRQDLPPPRRRRR